MLKKPIIRIYTSCHKAGNIQIFAPRTALWLTNLQIICIYIYYKKQWFTSIGACFRHVVHFILILFSINERQPGFCIMRDGNKIFLEASSQWWSKFFSLPGLTLGVTLSQYKAHTNKTPKNDFVYILGVNRLKEYSIVITKVHIVIYYVPIKFALWRWRVCLLVWPLACTRMTMADSAISLLYRP